MEITIHLDRLDDGNIVWWAESDAQPLSATAPTLYELKAIVESVLEAEGWGEPTFCLAVPGPTSTDQAAPSPVEGAAPEAPQVRLATV